jgi:hypothetical protein
MRCARWVVVATLLVSASGAQGQGQGQGTVEPARPEGQPPSALQTATPTLQDACIGVLRGQYPANQDRVALIQECEALLRDGRGSTQAAVAPGQQQADPQPGQSVLAAFGQAGNELFGRPAPGAPQGMGMRRAGPVRNTLTTNPIGWFDGTGLNLELARALNRKFAWTVGGRYSSTDATNGSVASFGAAAGVDVFLIGQNNEGLRLGPRLSADIGRETFQGTTTFARMGGSGELGYSFIATNGVTGQLSGGYGIRLAGDENDVFDNTFTGGDSGPYVKLNLGYSW